MSKTKIGLDVDGLLAHFTKGFYEWFNQPFVPPTQWADPFISQNFKKIVNMPAFWMGLEILNFPDKIDFDVYCYITARPVASHITYRWLINNGFSDRPVFTVGSNGEQHNTKTEVINLLGITHFIDDHEEHVVDINKNTDCTCFLYTQPHNINSRLEPRLNCLTELNQYL